MAKRSEKFPKQIFVTREDAETDDSYLVINASAADIGDGVEVAIYAFQGTKRMVVTRELK